MSEEQPTFETCDADSFCFAMHTNTRYREQNDRLLIKPGMPNHPINWQKMFAQAQERLEEEAQPPENFIITTTATLAHIRGPRITTAHTGDSRATIIIVNPEDCYAREVQLTKDNSHWDIDTQKGSRISPEITTHDMREDRLFKLSRERMFLVLETDGTHIHCDKDVRASHLTHHMHENKEFEITRETLAEYFVSLALQHNSSDNMGIIVTELDKKDKKRSDLVGVFDGAGAIGHIASDPACGIFNELSQTPPRDYLETLRSPSKALLACNDLLNNAVERLFGIDLS